MFFKVPDDYLKYRLEYIQNFYNSRASFIKFVHEDTNVITMDNSVMGFQFRLEELLKINKKSHNEGSPFNFNSATFHPERYIDIKELAWFKKDRLRWLVANLILSIYRIYRYDENINSLINNLNISPVDFFYHSGESIKYDELILFIDIMVILCGKDKIEKELLNKKERIADLEKKYPIPFNFIRDSNELDWLALRLVKESIFNNIDINYLCEIINKETIASNFDFWALNKTEPEVKLFLLETRKSLSQKRFRNKVKDKEVLNTYISKQAKRRLKYLAKKHQININEVLEIFILGHDKRTQSEKLIEALESTME
nr:hypothetical protein [uncultured Moellerella sp.]